MTNQLPVKSNWNILTENPPNKRVEVKDLDGNIATAYPTYYRFKFLKNKRILSVDPYWDGGWLIEAKDFSNPLTSQIIAWRELPNQYKS